VKLRILHDSNGKILGAVPIDENAPVQVGMQAGPGHTIGDFDVPAQHAHETLEQLLPNLSVDTTSKKLLVG
jgi:hypothetical protein